MNVSFGKPSLGPPPSHPLSERELIAQCRERVASFDSIGRGIRRAGSAAENAAGPVGRSSVVFTSDGEIVPPGQYLVEEWTDGIWTLAWREDPSRVWCDPIETEGDDR